MCRAPCVFSTGRCVSCLFSLDKFFKGRPSPVFFPPPSLRGYHVLADGARDFSSTRLLRQHDRSLSLILLIAIAFGKGSGAGGGPRGQYHSALFCSGCPVFNTSLAVSVFPTSCHSVVEELRSETTQTSFSAIHRRRSCWNVSGIPRRNIEEYLREVGELQGDVSTNARRSRQEGRTSTKFCFLKHGSLQHLYWQDCDKIDRSME